MSGSIINFLLIFSLTTSCFLKDFLIDFTSDYYDYGEDDFGTQVNCGFWNRIGFGRNWKLTRQELDLSTMPFREDPSVLTTDLKVMKIVSVVYFICI